MNKPTKIIETREYWDFCECLVYIEHIYNVNCDKFHHWLIDRYGGYNGQEITLHAGDLMCDDSIPPEWEFFFTEFSDNDELIFLLEW